MAESKTVGINKNVNANSANARGRVAEAKGAGVVKNVATVSKAATIRLHGRTKALGDCVLG